MKLCHNHYHINYQSGIMNSANNSSNSDQSINIDRTFDDKLGKTIQQIMEYLVKALVENNNFH